jgi:hypothetical protein
MLRSKKYKTQLWTVDELQFIMRFVTKISADFAESPWIVLMHFPHRSSGNLAHPGIYLFSENWEEKHGKTMEFPLSLLRNMRGHARTHSFWYRLLLWNPIRFRGSDQLTDAFGGQGRVELRPSWHGVELGNGGTFSQPMWVWHLKIHGKNVKLMVKHHVPYFLNGTLWFWFLGFEPASVYTPRNWHCLKCFFLRWLFPNQLLLYISICSGI